MRVNVSIDNAGNKVKAYGREIPRMKRRVAGNWQEIELQELADLNGNEGYAIIPAHLESGTAACNCTSMQLFALDFDHGCTFGGIKGRCDSIGLGIAYAYHTFSSSDKEEKFHIVFVLEEAEKDPFIIKATLLMLHKIFPECDHSCINMDRMFFGGKELIWFDETARFSLVQLYHPFLKSLDTGKHYSEKMRSFASKSGVLFSGKYLVMGELKDLDAIIGGNTDSAVIHITGESPKSPFFIAEGKLHQSIAWERQAKRKIMVKDGETLCPLYNDFIAGKYLSHDVRFAILTNLLSVNGGIKIFLEIIRWDYGEDYEKWENDLKYIKGYYPKRCSEKFCPYYASCENQGTMVNTWAMDRRVYQAEENYAGIHEAEECLQENLEKAFCDSRQGIHLIKAQTGLRKTRAYIRLIRNNPCKKFLVALPTNKLKEEVRTELIRKARIPAAEIFMTASVHGNALIPKDIQETVSEAHNNGIHNKTKEIIAEYKSKIEDYPDKRREREECEKILKGIHGADGERIILTTHAYFSQLDESVLKKYTVLIDEDFLQLQVFNKMCKISTSCLQGLAGSGLLFYSDIASEMLHTKTGEYKKLENKGICAPLPEEKLEELDYYCTGDNINDLGNAGSFVRMEDRDSGGEIVQYFCPVSLPKGKYIMLSATFNYNIYQRYFGEKMDIYTYTEQKAAYRGSLKQYTYHSLGRKDLSNKGQVFSFVQEISGNSNIPVITFLKYSYLRENGINVDPSQIHFGNGTGRNVLSGKDMAVVGTPYKVDEYYKLIACYLGGEVNGKENMRPGFQRADYKGNNFLITTYRDPVLREVQLYSIESDLEQCIGRARLLRNNCTVYVFSSFPCEQAELYLGDYLKSR